MKTKNNSGWPSVVFYDAYTMVKLLNGAGSAGGFRLYEQLVIWRRVE